MTSNEDWESFFFLSIPLLLLALLPSSFYFLLPALLPSPRFLLPLPCFRLLLLLPSPLCFLLLLAWSCPPCLVLSSLLGLILLAWSYPPCLRRVGVGIIKEKGLTSVLLMRPLRRERDSRSARRDAFTKRSD